MTNILIYAAMSVGGVFGFLAGLDRIQRRKNRAAAKVAEFQLKVATKKQTRGERAAPLRSHVLSKEDLDEMDEFFKS